MNSLIRKIFVYTISFVLLALVLLPNKTYAEKNNYPRLANYFLRLDRLTDINVLAKSNVVILPVETQILKPNLSKDLKKINPDIILLAYVPTQSFHILWNNELHNRLKKNIDNSWWLRDPKGNIVYLNSHLKMLNVSSGWSKFLAGFITNNVLSTDFWDGVFYDMVDDNIAWLNDGYLDVNNDKQIDSKGLANRLWLDGMTYLIQKTREFNPRTLIVINGTSNPQVQKYINGRMFENFPTAWYGDGSWNASTKTYIDAHNDPKYFPHIFILNTDAHQTDGAKDYKRLRFGLTSALLGNGYFSFDHGDEDHGQLWWFDEYNINLGTPIDGPVDIKGKQQELTDGVWMREFEYGIVVVNSTNQRKKVELDQEYEKIHGDQVPDYNSGEVVDTLFLEPLDGIILHKRTEDIIGFPFVNGAYNKIFNNKGDNIRTGFIKNKRRHPKGSSIQISDINNDGYYESIISAKNKISIYANTGKLLKEFFPYSAYYNGQINFSVGDTNNNGYQEIITGTSYGYGSHVKSFSIDGRLLDPGFFAYDKNFRGGVHVAMCDTNGNGKNEIVTAAGKSGGPHIRIFSTDGRLLSPGFFAYSPYYKGGVHFACADVDKDGKSEIVTGPLRGPAYVKVFDHSGKLEAKEFLAFNKSNQKGVYISVFDIDNDLQYEIITQTMHYFTP